MHDLTRLSGAKDYKTRVQAPKMALQKEEIRETEEEKKKRTESGVKKCFQKKLKIKPEQQERTSRRRLEGREQKKREGKKEIIKEKTREIFINNIYKVKQQEVWRCLSTEKARNSPFAS